MKSHHHRIARARHRAMNAPNYFAQFEMGKYDGRALPIAFSMWWAQLSYALIQTYLQTMQGIWRIAVTCVACYAGMIVALLWIRAQLLHRAQARQQILSIATLMRHALRTTIVWYCLILLAACGGAILRAHTVYSTYTHDPIIRSTQQQSTPAQVIFQTQHVTASWRRDYACTMRVQAQYAQIDGIGQPTQATLQIFANGQLCTSTLGQLVQATGQLHKPTLPDRAGISPTAWLDVQDDNTVIQHSSRINRLRQRIFQSFFEQTQQFDEQSAMIIPGITMGLLGDRIIPTSSTANRIDSAHAKYLQQLFTQAGIVHLMAVSGGHVVLIITLCTSLCATLQIHRTILAILNVQALLVLRLIMMPAHSLDRALMMGCIAQIAHAIGRPSSTLSTYSWSIIVLLIAEPNLATDFGFALSCASVGAIITWSKSLTRALHRIMPQVIAMALAVTLSAQCATTPIAALITPQVSLWAPLANLIITPVLTIATCAGLLGLCLAWCAPLLAHYCLVVCSWCCSWIVHGAELCVRLPGNTLALPAGVTGALITSGVELTILLCLRHVNQYCNKRMDNVGKHAFSRPAPTLDPWQKVRLWFEETRIMLGR